MGHRAMVSRTYKSRYYWKKRKVKDRTEATHALPNKPLVDSSVDVAWPRFRYKEVSKPTTQANQSIFSSYHYEDEIVCTKEDQEQCERKKVA
jgi:hypothetical protein